MVYIECFVFFDIETTGLPWQERNRTKITELSFIAVSRMDLQRFTRVPPVSSKLTLLFNPQKYISPEVADLTGLSNEVLDYCPTFIEKSTSMISFLDELPKPTCLVSHNGNSFDYKILLAECLDAEVALPNGLLCVDSLRGFRKIFKDTSNIPNQINQSQSEINIYFDTVCTDDEMSGEDECDSRILKGSLETSKDGKFIRKVIINNSVVLKLDANTFASEYEYDEKINQEHARIMQQRAMTNNREADSACNDESEHQMHQNMKSKSQKRNLPSKVKNTSTPKVEKANKKGEFTLTGLYKRLLNKEVENAHRAEDDCKMLLECVMVVKNDFLPWADQSCQKLNEIKPFIRY